jgi:hypothetical protein
MMTIDSAASALIKKLRTIVIVLDIAIFSLELRRSQTRIATLPYAESCSANKTIDRIQPDCLPGAHGLACRPALNSKKQLSGTRLTLFGLF